MASFSFEQYNGFYSWISCACKHSFAHGTDPDTSASNKTFLAATEPTSFMLVIQG
jgi:hypothetical protein